MRLVPEEISFSDYIGLNAAVFEWAESYDSKDWTRLRACVAPTVRVDYRAFLGKLWEAMPAEDYVKMASDPHVLGDPLLKTQHFIGASKWEKISDTEVMGFHQLRVPHQRYIDTTMREVAVKGHAHGSNQHWYRKVDGIWKFAGLAVEIRWGEFEFDQVFASGEKEFGESEKKAIGTQIATGVTTDSSLLQAQEGDHLWNSQKAQESTSGTSTTPAGASAIENMSAEERALKQNGMEANKGKLPVEGVVRA